MRPASNSIGLALAGLTLIAAAPALADGAAIRGKVEAMPAKFLEETVVYVKKVDGAYPPKTLEMDQKGMQFIPHVMTVTVGDTVNFLNHDSVFHNVLSKDNEGYYVGTFGPNQAGKHTFGKVGVYAQLCSIHPEMLAYVFVGQNPYAAVVDKSGNFTIKDVPPGKYEVEVWNAHLKTAAQTVTVSATRTADVNFSLKR